MSDHRAVIQDSGGLNTRSWAMPAPSTAELQRREKRRVLQRKLDQQQGIPMKRPHQDREVARLLGEADV
jgi:hypothetical protein